MGTPDWSAYIVPRYIAMQHYVISAETRVGTATNRKRLPQPGEGSAPLFPQSQKLRRRSWQTLDQRTSWQSHPGAGRGVQRYHRFTRGPDAILNTGLYLSIIAVAIMLVTGWLGWEMVYRRRVGIAEGGTL
jgi:hypothetical protein